MIELLLEQSQGWHSKENEDIHGSLKNAPHNATDQNIWRISHGVHAIQESWHHHPVIALVFLFCGIGLFLVDVLHRQQGRTLLAFNALIDIFYNIIVNILKNHQGVFLCIL
jgi:hypothetical protein